MRFKDTLKLHKALIRVYGDDLVYSIAYDEGKYYLAISVHKSNTWKFEHGGNMQSCLIDDFNDDIRTLVNKIKDLYDGVLIRKDKDNNDDETTTTVGEKEETA